MTAGIVTQMNPVTDYKVTALNSVGEKSADFSEVFKASAGRNNEQPNETVATADKKNDVAAQEEPVSDKPVENKKAETEQTSKDDGRISKDQAKNNEPLEEDDISEEVEAVVQTLLAEVAQILDVNVEDVTEALETLNLTETDLLDASIIPQLTATVEGDGNAVEVMTDEKLFADVKEITQKVEEAVNVISEQTGATEEEIKEFIKVEDKDSVIGKTQDNETVLQNNAEESPEVNVTAPQETKQRRSTEDNGRGDAEAQSNPAQTIVENIKAAATGKSEATAPAETPDMERIYAQVQESVKVHMSEEVTEMEMNLHPASLGNVKVQVASRDGVITANFVTQNETVKAALESQIVQLKEDMNEQGIKVESIEITLASHAFEENLSEGNEGAATESETKKKRRSINLNEIDDDADINVEDEVRIAREMMMHNGTTVDYLA